MMSIADRGAHASRRVGIALGCLIAFISAGASASESRAPRLNILLLVAEDLSSHLGSFGDAVARTPRLDALASEGVRFGRVFTTAPVCAPSRAALITGVHQNALGAQHMRTVDAPGGGYRSVPPPEIKAFPELLRAAGYYTFTDDKLDYQFSGPLAGSGPFTIWDAEGRAGAKTRWQGRAPGQPFFGLINFEVTHESGTFAPLGAWPHSPMHLVMQLVRAFTFGFEPAALAPDPRSVVLPPYYPDVSSVRTELARHYGNIRFMDREVGEILDALEREGLAGDTIVIWTSDHGDGLPRAKRDLFDSGLHVPMIVRWPEGRRPADLAVGVFDERLVSFVDLAPAILALAGLAKPAWMHGQDFLDARIPARPYVFAARDRMDEVVDRQRAVRDARFKYIRSDHPELPGGHPLAFRDNQQMTRDLRAMFEAGRLDAVQARWFEPTGEERLFDTESDPFEIHDLAGDPAFARELARMRAALDGFLSWMGDLEESDEQTMIARIQCDGRACVTPPPTLHPSKDCVEIRTTVRGASIGYRLGDGGWRLYTGCVPVEVPGAVTLTAKAVRYGWDESAEVAIEVGQAE